MAHLDAYIRVSKVGKRKGPTFISPAVQRERIEKWASAMGHEIAEWHEDLDQPGRKRKRPGLLKMLGRVEGRQVEGVVVAKLNRFGRSTLDIHRNLEQIVAAGGTLYAVAEGIDTSNAFGRFLLAIMAALGELEAEQIGENWYSSRSHAAARGVYLAEPPAGYDKGPDGSLTPNEAAPLIRDVFERRVAGDSWVAISRRLNEQGIPAPRGGRWTVTSVRNAISNRAYLGEAFDAERQPIPGAHEALISPALFEAAAIVKGVAPGRSGRASGLLAGVLRCAGCRYTLRISQGSGGAKNQYVCKSKRGDTAGACAAPVSVTAAAVEPIVMERFWEFVGDWEASGVNPDDELTEARSLLAKAESELAAALDERLVEALGAGSDAYLKALRDRQEAVDNARQGLDRARAHTRGLALPDVGLRKMWPDLSLQEQRKLLAAAFDCVFVRKASSTRAPTAERLHFCLAGDGPEIPTQGRRWSARPFDFPVAAEALSAD